MRARGPYATTPRAPAQPIAVARTASRIARANVAAGIVAITPRVAAGTPGPTAAPSTSGCQLVAKAVVATATVRTIAQIGRPPVRTANPTASAVDKVTPATWPTSSGTPDETRTAT